MFLPHIHIYSFIESILIMEGEVAVIRGGDVRCVDDVLQA